MNALAPYRTHTIRNAKILCLKDHEEFEEEIEIGGFFSDGAYCWVATGAFFEVYESSSGRRIVAIDLSLAPGENEPLLITCVTDVGEGCLVIGCQSGHSGGHLFLFSVAKGKLVSQASVVKKVTSLAYVPPSCAFLLPASVQSEDDGVWLFVGTQEGQVSLMQLSRSETTTVEDATVTYVSKVDVMNDSAISQKHKKSVSFVDRGPSKCIPLNDSSFSAGHFLFVVPKRKREEGEEKELEVLGSLPCQEVKVTCMKVIPQIGSVVVAYSFGGFQFYSLSKLELEGGSSGFRADGLPITFLGFQEPENDPRKYCYMWAVFNDPADPFTAIAMMYQLCYEQKEISEGGFPIFSDFRSQSVRFTVDLGNFVQKARGSRSKSAMCRAISCFTLNSAQTQFDLEDTPFDPESSENLAQPTLSLFAFVVETQDEETDPSAEVQRHIILFDINAYYQAQMPDCPTFRKDGLNSYLGVFSYEEGPLLVDVYVDQKKILKFQNHTVMEQHFYPSSLAFDSTVLHKEGLQKFEHLGVQRQLIDMLNCATSAVVFNPEELCKIAEIYGLIPPDQPPLGNESLPMSVYRECMLNILLEYGCLNPLRELVKFLAYNDSGQDFDIFDLMSWIWSKVSALKTANDVLSMPLFNMSCVMTENSTVDALHRNGAQLRLLLSVLEVMDSCAVGRIQENMLLALRQRIKATRLITDYLEAILWFVHAGLLPETELNEQEAEQEPTEPDFTQHWLPYPVSKIREFYASRRRALAEGASAINSQKVLLIDNLVEALDKQVTNLWQEENEGTYPPASLYSLLQIYLLDGPVEAKHCVVQYLLLDVAAALREVRSSNLLDELHQFSAAFEVSPARNKVTIGYWMLDHMRFEDGLSYLLHPTIRFADIGIKDYRSVIKLLIFDNECRRALRFSSLRPCAEPEFEDTLMHLRLLLLNGFVGEAFDYQRTKRTTDNSELLLMHVFTGCAEKGRLDLIMRKPFSKFEEEIFVKFLQSWKNPKAIDLLLAFYIQRGRFVDAAMLQKKLKDQKMSNPLRDGLVTAYMKVLPPLTGKLTKSVSSKQPVVTQTRSYPKPLSAIVKPGTGKVASNSTKYLSEIVECTRLALLATPTRNRKRKVDEEEDIPFLKNIRLDEAAPPSPITSAKKAPRKEVVLPPSAKKIRIADEKEDVYRESVLGSDIRAVLRTPTITRIRSQRRSGAVGNPPLSILKARTDHEDTTVTRSKHLRFSTLPPVVFQSPEASDKSLPSTASPMDVTSVRSGNIFEREPTRSVPMELTEAGADVRRAVVETRDWVLQQIQENEKLVEATTFNMDLTVPVVPQIEATTPAILSESAASDSESFHSFEGSSGSRTRMDLSVSMAEKTEPASNILEVLKKERENADQWKDYFKRLSQSSVLETQRTEKEEVVGNREITGEVSAFANAIDDYNRRATILQENAMEETNVGFQLPQNINQQLATFQNTSMDVTNINVPFPAPFTSGESQENLMEETEVGFKMPEGASRRFTVFDNVAMEETRVGIELTQESPESTPVEQKSGEGAAPDESIHIGIGDDFTVNMFGGKHIDFGRPSLRYLETTSVVSLETFSQQEGADQMEEIREESPKVAENAVAGETSFDMSRESSIVNDEEAAPQDSVIAVPERIESRRETDFEAEAEWKVVQTMETRRTTIYHTEIMEETVVSRSDLIEEVSADGMEEAGETSALPEVTSVPSFELPSAMQSTKVSNETQNQTTVADKTGDESLRFQPGAFGEYSQDSTGMSYQECEDVTVVDATRMHGIRHLQAIVETPVVEETEKVVVSPDSTGVSETARDEDVEITKMVPSVISEVELEDVTVADATRMGGVDDVESAVEMTKMVPVVVEEFVANTDTQSSIAERIFGRMEEHEVLDGKDEELDYTEDVSSEASSVTQPFSIGEQEQRDEVVAEDYELRIEEGGEASMSLNLTSVDVIEIEVNESIDERQSKGLEEKEVSMLNQTEDIDETMGVIVDVSLDSKEVHAETRTGRDFVGDVTMQMTQIVPSSLKLQETIAVETEMETEAEEVHPSPVALEGSALENVSDVTEKEDVAELEIEEIVAQKTTVEAEEALPSPVAVEEVPAVLEHVSAAKQTEDVSESKWAEIAVPEVLTKSLPEANVSSVSEDVPFAAPLPVTSVEEAVTTDMEQAVTTEVTTVTNVTADQHEDNKDSFEKSGAAEVTADVSSQESFGEASDNVTSYDMTIFSSESKEPDSSSSISVLESNNSANASQQSGSSRVVTRASRRYAGTYKPLSEIDIQLSPLAIPTYPATPKPRKPRSTMKPVLDFSDSSDDEFEFPSKTRALLRRTQMITPMPQLAKQSESQPSALPVETIEEENIVEKTEEVVTKEILTMPEAQEKEDALVVSEAIENLATNAEEVIQEAMELAESVDITTIETTSVSIERVDVQPTDETMSLRLEVSPSEGASSNAEGLSSPDSAQTVDSMDVSPDKGPIEGPLTDAATLSSPGLSFSPPSQSTAGTAAAEDEIPEEVVEPNMEDDSHSKEVEKICSEEPILESQHTGTVEADIDEMSVVDEPEQSLSERVRGRILARETLVPERTEVTSSFEKVVDSSVESANISKTMEAQSEIDQDRFAPKTPKMATVGRRKSRLSAATTSGRAKSVEPTVAPKTMRSRRAISEEKEKDSGSTKLNVSELITIPESPANEPEKQEKKTRKRKQKSELGFPRKRLRASGDESDVVEETDVAEKTEDVRATPQIFTKELQVRVSPLDKALSKKMPVVEESAISEIESQPVKKSKTSGQKGLRTTRSARKTEESDKPEGETSDSSPGSQEKTKPVSKRSASVDAVAETSKEPKPLRSGRQRREQTKPVKTHKKQNEESSDSESPLRSIVQKGKSLQLLTSDPEDAYGFTPAKKDSALDVSDESLSPERPASKRVGRPTRTRSTSSHVSMSPDLFAAPPDRSMSAEPVRRRRSSLRSSSVEPDVGTEPPLTPTRSSSRLARRRSSDFEDTSAIPSVLTPRRSTRVTPTKKADTSMSESDSEKPMRKSSRRRLTTPEPMSPIQEATSSGKTAEEDMQSEVLEAEEPKKRPIKEVTRRKRQSMAPAALPTILEATSEEPPPEIESTGRTRIQRKKSTKDEGESSQASKTRRVSLKSALRAIREDSTDSDEEIPQPQQRKPVLLKRPRSRPAPKKK